MATTPTPSRPAPRHPDVPLAVWPLAQTTAQHQRTGRYLPASSAHPAKMLPSLAARIVTEFSAPGQLVVDPMAGIGTTVIEAAALRRRAVGVELEDRWADLAGANLDHILDHQQRALADIRVGDARQLPAVLGNLSGTVDLMVVSPPYGCDVGNPHKTAWGAGGGLCPTTARNYSPDRTNLGHARGRSYQMAMADIYTACHAVLRPGGLLVTVTRNTRRAGRLNDLAGLTVTMAGDAGFTYLQHIVALLCAVRDGRLVARPSFWAGTQLRNARARGEPAHLTAHEDVLCFRREGQA